MNRAGILLGSLNELILDVQEAFEGSDRTSLGRTLGGVEMMAEKLPSDLEDAISRIMAQLEPILANLRVLSESAADPSGSVMAILDSEGDVYTSLTESLDAIAGTLRNLEKTSEFIPAQLPQVAVLIADLHKALLTAEDVLVSLTNNPLLKGGVPQQTQTRAGGASARDVEF
jgi:phospholipid/cholesterol/gamma-HCH transport system substrate-binding protein